MSYLSKFLLKETNDVLDLCGTDGHQALQLFHLKFHPVHFWFQTNQCKTILVQGNLSIADYTSNYMWYIVNRALILNQKNDIVDEFTYNMFISKMKRCDDIRSIIAMERHSQDECITN